MHEVVLLSEQIENGPPGLRARLTQRIGGSDRFEEVFELASPERAFIVYQHNRWTRV